MKDTKIYVQFSEEKENANLYLNLEFNEKRQNQIKLTVVTRSFDHIYNIALLMKSRYINGRFVRSLCLRLCQTFGSIFVLLLRLVRMETCVTHMFSACLVIQNASYSPSKRMHKNKIVSHGWLVVLVFRSFHSFVFTRGHQKPL